MATKSVQVVARLRPALDDHEDLCTFADSEENVIDIINYRNQEETLRYNFSRVFDQNASQEDVFSVTVDPVLDDLFRGYNASVLAYGPTGAGKTYTILGSTGDPGIIPRSVNGLLDRMDLNAGLADTQLTFSYLEIYNEKLIDLLVKEPSGELTIREGANRSIYVSGLTETRIQSYDEFAQQFVPATKRRTVARTKLNEHSSRSHSIIMLKVHVQPKTSRRSLVGKLYIIDLAGSENNKRTGNRGIRLKESGAINNSLFVLGQVVDALNHNMNCVPYRDSKLTRLLQDSLGGNAQALVITNLAPELSHYMLTYTTLNFAQKTRQVVNKPTINDQGTPLVRRTFEPVSRRARVVVAEPDSSLSSAPSIAGVSFTPLKQSLLSPINHTREDITHLNRRMEKLESLIELQSLNSFQQQPDPPQPRQPHLQQTTVTVTDLNQTKELRSKSQERKGLKENNDPSPGPVLRIRRKFDWGSPVSMVSRVESPLDCSALFVRDVKPIKRKKWNSKSTAATQTPVKIKDVNLPEFDPSLVDSDVTQAHNDEILRVLNEGSLKDLCRLSTMGAKRSQAVVDYRRYVGPFQEVLDICKVPAFTKAFVEKFLRANYINLHT